MAGWALVGSVLSGLRPAAQYMPATMSESYPPHLPSTRTGSTSASRAMPAMPMTAYAVVNARMMKTIGRF